MVVISGADMQLAIRGISWLPNLLLHLYIQYHQHNQQQN